MRRKINPKLMKKTMKKMGIELNEMDNVEEVIIKCTDKDIIISNPKVTLVKSSGINTYQIMGEETEKPKTGESSEEELSEEQVQEAEVPPEDVDLVAAQASVSREEAEAALKAAGGNLAKAILSLKNR